MPNATITLDTTRFEAAVKFVFDNTRRALPEILNRAALVAIIGGRGVEGAMQRTKRAAAEQIRAVPVKAVVGYVRQRHPEKMSPARLKELVSKEYKRRVAAIGYTAVVGWNRAAQDLGGSGTRRGSSSGKGFATMGYAKPASGGNYEVEMVNTAPAAELIGSQALQDALNDTAQDMIDYWEQRTGATFRA